MQPIYLDNAATTRIDPRVAQAIYKCHLEGYVNPASQHQAGQRARRALEQAREKIGQILGCSLTDMHADHILLTSGGTEANNLALLGMVGSPPGRVIISAIEHPSVLGPAERLLQLGFDVQRIRVTRHGVVELDHLQELLTDNTRLVSVMLGNNETGALQPVQEIAELCGRAGVPVHTDAVQVVGKLPVHFRRLGVTAMSFTAHKLHGPLGIGALIVRPDVRLDPLLFGGFQQAALRPGTESVALAVGFSCALELWVEEAEARLRRMTELRDQLEDSLRAELPDLVVNGRNAPRLPHISNVCCPSLDRQALLMALDFAGVQCSSGSACASGSSEPSHVLRAMGLPAEVLLGSIRLSLEADSTESTIVDAVQRISHAIKHLQKPKSRVADAGVPGS